METDGKHALAEERSLALHRLVAERLADDPAVLEGARARVRQWLQDGLVSRPYAEAWRAALDSSPDEIRALLVDPGERARALRQTSPFAGVIDPRTRWRVWQSVGEQFGGR